MDKDSQYEKENFIADDILKDGITRLSSKWQENDGKFRLTIKGSIKERVTASYNIKKTLEYLNILKQSDQDFSNLTLDKTKPVYMISEDSDDTQVLIMNRDKYEELQYSIKSIVQEKHWKWFDNLLIFLP